VVSAQWQLGASNGLMMSQPSTARNLARELSPTLEEIANLKYLLKHHPSSSAILEQHEQAAFDRLMKRVLDALAD
jgi:hypothetical protein